VPKRSIRFDAVRKEGLALAGVEDGTAYGSPALKLRGKMFACLAIHRSAEPDSLIVQIGFPQRDELIAADPNTYYLTDHYVGYPVVLARLARIHDDALRDLLQMGWRFVSDARPSKRARERRTR
jgi:hypothetical protein